MKNLPPGSALHRELDPEGSAWTNTEELLAVLIEQVDFGNRNFIRANSKKSGPKPLKVPRPKRPQLLRRRPQKGPKEQSSVADIKSVAGARIRVDKAG